MAKITVPTIKDLALGFTWYMRGHDESKSKRGLALLVIGILVYPAGTTFATWYARYQYAKRNNLHPQYASPAPAGLRGAGSGAGAGAGSTRTIGRDPNGTEHDHRAAAEAGPK